MSLGISDERVSMTSGVSVVDHIRSTLMIIHGIPHSSRCPHGDRSRSGGKVGVPSSAPGKLALARLPYLRSVIGSVA